MTITRQMLGAARRARTVLGSDAADRLVEFVRARGAGDGGFVGRHSRSDLYYTTFALQCLAAMDAPSSDDCRGEYLAAFGAGEGLDLVHLGCLARCWALPGGRFTDETTRAAMAANVRRFACPDGGYNTVEAAACGSAYGCFLALGALQDLAAPAPDADAMAKVLAAVKAPGGGYANTPSHPVVSTPATAAAALALHHLGHNVDDETTAWLLARFSPSGGCLAAPGAPAPDLLATAVALHALAAAGADISSVRWPCLHYVDSLRLPSGGFRAHRADETPDTEYAFYGLLALGHLARPPDEA